jgi:hypothetical protein
LSYYVPGQKLGGGTTGHAKKAGRRPDPKFDDYTQKFSDLQLKFKNRPQNTVVFKMLSHFVKYWLNQKFFFCIFVFCINVLSNSARSAEFPVY